MCSRRLQFFAGFLPWLFSTTSRDSCNGRCECEHFSAHSGCFQVERAVRRWPVCYFFQIDNGNRFIRVCSGHRVFVINANFPDKNNMSSVGVLPHPRSLWLRLATFPFVPNVVDHSMIANHSGPWLWTQTGPWSMLVFVCPDSEVASRWKSSSLHSWF